MLRESSVDAEYLQSDTLHWNMFGDWPADMESKWLVEGGGGRELQGGEEDGSALGFRG